MKERSVIMSSEEPKMMFANRIGLWHKKFCWLPVKSYDNRIIWLKTVSRASYQVKAHLQGGLDQFFVYSIEEQVNEKKNK